ncbi:hypothetical protein EUGRSUZ_K00130 [Eucalyptus grandis]|uniref:Uncharacterized protein n=2 Tax=Eucalyptus grandis TaxID=71139 RepID=A0ACC3IS19_EUCGR|nr:hypothetical protein EUGRSUZ_K00130 [Eucalyptus grandis]
MFPRWSRALNQLSRVSPIRNVEVRDGISAFSHRSYAKGAAAAAAPVAPEYAGNDLSARPAVNLERMFWSKPCSLALAPDSPLRIEEPKYEGIRHVILKLMLFYSKQSKSIRGANVVYRRILHQVDKPAIYEDGKEGAEFGQYLYEIYNHDVELRVSKAGVNLLLTKWMKDLEKIFYGNIVAYDSAMLPEAKRDEMTNIIWRNVFSDDGSPRPNGTAVLGAVQAMARYACRESHCLSLTDKEAMFSGNFMFTSLKSTTGSENK